MDQSRRFKSSLHGSDCGSNTCGSKRKLPGHIESITSSSVKGIMLNLVLASLNLATSAVSYLLGLCTSEWGWTLSDRSVEVLKGKPIIDIILWDWYLLAAPLSLLWAFWWPPNACELKNFLMQKLQEKTLPEAGLDCESESPSVESKFPPRLRFSHSPWLRSSVSSLLPSLSGYLFCSFFSTISLSASPWEIISSQISSLEDVKRKLMNLGSAMYTMILWRVLDQRREERNGEKH